MTHVTSGESARSCVRVGQFVPAVGAENVPVFLRSAVRDSSGDRMPVGCRQVTPGIPDDLCCVAYVAAAGGWAEMDTWLLPRDVRCRIVQFVSLALKVVTSDHVGITRGISSAMSHVPA
jgi:hypothetical protein